jgi:hypothetical protein
MSLLFAWVPRDAAADPAPVVESMAAALRVHAGQQLVVATAPGLGVGVIEPPSLGATPEVDLSPAVSADGRHRLWMAGEVFAAGDPDLVIRNPIESQTLGFRRRLLSHWLENGIDAFRDLDGEYQIGVWDGRERTLTVVNDRFGGLPLYWAESSAGVAVAGGVRGVLVAPGIAVRPDAEALREAVTFGGYRLGTRTNIDGVEMVGGATELTIRAGKRRSRRYWTWTSIPPRSVRNVEEAVSEVAARWRTAVARRLSGPGRFGQTLSGGLDSRAILAEVAPKLARAWTAITYGVPGCDDERYARQAAHAVGADWRFLELYAGDWLALRDRFIQPTDGLMQLGDLMHVESLDLQRASFDVHLSGYVGDAVSGPTFGDVGTAEEALLACPFYGTPLGLPYEEALRRVQDLSCALDGASERFFLFDHKLPQSTNRWPSAWRPWLRVRKPFLDYEFFDYCQGLPSEIRTRRRLHERWLRGTYPACFARIPHQKTGLPVLSARWRVQLARVARRSRRLLSEWAPPALCPAPRIRAYQDDDRIWRTAGVVDRLTSLILRPGSLCCDILGRDRVTDLIRVWKDTAAAPAQVVGALYVYEAYHRDLPGVLARAASSVGSRQVAQVTT